MTLSISSQFGFQPRTRLSVVALAAGLAVAARLASAALVWYPDLASATDASRGSGKPVLAIIDASWNQSGNDIFANPEVAAVVSACFEPVRVDAEANPEFTRQLNVEHVPEACVLAGDGTPLTRFECSPDVSEFVAAAARAAQVAATTAPTLSAQEAITPESPAESLPAAEHQARKGSATATASALANKVRNLAGFAETDAAQAGQPSRFRPVPVPVGFGASAGIEPDMATATSATIVADSPSADPTLAQTPPLWPAEPAAASAFARFEPQQQQPLATSPASYTDHSSFPQPGNQQPGNDPTLPSATRDIEPAGSPPTSWLAGPSADAAAESPAFAPAQPATSAPAAPADAATALPSTTAATEPTPAPASATASMIAFFTKPWSVFSRPKAQAPAQPPTLPPAQSMTPAAVAATAAPSAPDPHGSMPLGLEGYCPVTLVERGSWVEGRAQWGVRHRGRTYLFAGPEQQQAFLASPDRYAPALSGDDPVIAFESGRSEPGRRAYGVTYQSRMYLFSTPETRAAFSADPGRYTARVMIAEGLVAADGTRRF
jgi:YHS domain-containing protein